MDDKKVKDLEMKVQRLIEQVSALNQQVALLKRENNRSKSNITQIANHINRK